MLFRPWLWANLWNAKVFEGECWVCQYFSNLDQWKRKAFRRKSHRSASLVWGRFWNRNVEAYNHWIHFLETLLCRKQDKKNEPGEFGQMIQGQAAKSLPPCEISENWPLRKAQWSSFIGRGLQNCSDKQKWIKLSYFLAFGIWKKMQYVVYVHSPYSLQKTHISTKNH